MLARLSGLQSAGTPPPIVRLREEVVAKPDSYLRSDSELHPAAVLGEIDRLVVGETRPPQQGCGDQSADPGTARHWPKPGTSCSEL